MLLMYGGMLWNVKHRVGLSREKLRHVGGIVSYVEIRSYDRACDPLNIVLEIPDPDRTLIGPWSCP